MIEGWLYDIFDNNLTGIAKCLSDDRNEIIGSPNSGPIELDQSWADTCLSESSFGLIEVLY